MLSHPLTNFEIQIYHQNKPKLNGVYSSNCLPKMKDRAYSINLDKHKLIEIHWVAIYAKKTYLLTLIVLVLNIFLKRMQNLLMKIFIEYKNIIQ